jgi:hypothetical protein
VAKRVLREGRRPIPQAVAHQIFVDNVVEMADTLLANHFEVIEAGLEFPPPLLPGVLRDRLRERL